MFHPLGGFAHPSVSVCSSVLRPRHGCRKAGRLLARWKETGEVANGSYFRVVDQPIVPQAGVSKMTVAIRELVRSGDITSVGVRCDDQSR